jgi:hypothetical protein
MLENVSWPMKVGSLVKYVGSAAMYRDRVGIVAKLYGFIDERIDSALVHFAGLEGKGRDEVVDASNVRANRGKGDGLHPMAFDELKIIGENQQ